MESYYFDNTPAPGEGLTPPPSPPPDRNGKAALITGIIGMVLLLFCCAICLTLPLSIATIITARSSYRQQGNSYTAQAKAGLILGIISFVLSVLFVALIIILIAAAIIYA